MMERQKSWGSLARPGPGGKPLALVQVRQESSLFQGVCTRTCMCAYVCTCALRVCMYMCVCMAVCACMRAYVWWGRGFKPLKSGASVTASGSSFPVGSAGGGELVSGGPWVGAWCQPQPPTPSPTRLCLLPTLLAQGCKPGQPHGLSTQEVRETTQKPLELERDYL